MMANRILVVQIYATLDEEKRTAKMELLKALRQ